MQPTRLLQAVMMIFFISTILLKQYEKKLKLTHRLMRDINLFYFVILPILPSELPQPCIATLLTAISKITLLQWPCGKENIKRVGCPWCNAKCKMKKRTPRFYIFMFLLFTLSLCTA